jgi:hypothetical protein
LSTIEQDPPDEHRGRRVQSNVRYTFNSGAKADTAKLPSRADSVEKVENTAKKKFSQKLAGGGFLLRMRSSCEEEGRRKLLFKSTWSTVSDGFKRISGP